MATAIKTALKKAGVPTRPINQQVWQFLKDSGTHNANAVAKALKIPANNASSTMGQMRDRGMVTSTMELDKFTGHTVMYYSVNPKMKSYSLLPITAEAKARPKRSHKATAKSGMHDLGTAHLPVPPVVAPTPKPHILDTLSVREAHALFLELKAMFERPNAS